MTRVHIQFCDINTLGAVEHSIAEKSTGKAKLHLVFLDNLSLALSQYIGTQAVLNSLNKTRDGWQRSVKRREVSCISTLLECSDKPEVLYHNSTQNMQQAGFLFL